MQGVSCGTTRSSRWNRTRPIVGSVAAPDRRRVWEPAARVARTRNALNPVGNARLTALVGVLLLAPVAVELATIVLGVHSFMSLHVFVGLALIPAVALKLASTGWRFARYYTRSDAYLEHGAPQIAMRLLAPLFVAATVVLFASGIAMGVLHGHALAVA